MTFVITDKIQKVLRYLVDLRLILYHLIRNSIHKRG